MLVQSQVLVHYGDIDHVERYYIIIIVIVLFEPETSQIVMFRKQQNFQCVVSKQHTERLPSLSFRCRSVTFRVTSVLFRGNNTLDFWRAHARRLSTWWSWRLLTELGNAKILCLK